MVQTVKVGRRTRRKTVVVGDKTVTVNGGRSQTVNITLRGIGAALLRADGRLAAKLTVEQSQRILRSQNLTFREAKKKRARTRR